MARATQEDQEEVEGLGEPGEPKWADYPIDTVLIRNEPRTVHDVVRRIEKGSFVMDPDFQRDFIWPVDKQSKLIESVLMRIPLPVFYFAEDKLGRMIVVDGLQRLSTFKRFLDGELVLQLPEQPELTGKRFEQLSAKLQNRVEDCSLILYIIDAKVPERARLDIFERVNSGVPLTRQQMRNCLFMGPATRFLRSEASNDLFIEATGGSLRTESMRDREFVNRFCSFQLIPYQKYRDMDEFLADGLTIMNSLATNELKELAIAFRNGLTNNLHVFGKHAFRKHEVGQSGRNPLNASLWDLMSTGLSGYSEDCVHKRAQQLRAAFQRLLKNLSFKESISFSTNDTKKVRTRFQLAAQMFAEVFGDIEN